MTQLRLQPGDYAAAGDTNIFVVDSHSFWVTGYFEETKLPGVRVGATASIKLMGFSTLLEGHVASIGRGIADGNELRSNSGLPQVAPTFSWINRQVRAKGRSAHFKVCLQFSDQRGPGSSNVEILDPPGCSRSGCLLRGSGRDAGQVHQRYKRGHPQQF